MKGPALEYPRDAAARISDLIRKRAEHRRKEWPSSQEEFDTAESQRRYVAPLPTVEEIGSLTDTAFLASVTREEGRDVAFRRCSVTPPWLRWAAPGSVDTTLSTFLPLSRSRQDSRNRASSAGDADCRTSRCNRTHPPWLALESDTAFRLVRSILSVEKKLSIAALSQQSPLRLMLQVTP